MIKKLNAILALVLLAIVLVVPVTAETLTGVTSETYYDYTVYGTTSGASAQPLGTANCLYNGLQIHDIQNIGSPYNVVEYDITDHSLFVADAPNFLSLPITGRYNGSVIFTGTLGYQRKFSGTSETNYGFSYFTFDTWNSSHGLTGDFYIPFEKSGGGTYNNTVDYYGKTTDGYGTTLGAHTAGDALVFFSPSSGKYHNTAEVTITTGINFAQQYVVSNDWSATKPGGIGISGTVNKNGFAQIVSVYNMSTGSEVLITNEPISNTLPYNFTVAASTIRLSFTDGAGNRYNTTTLFSSTPTITPTPTSTPLPSGTVRTYFQNIDGTFGGRIFDSNIALKDDVTGVWSNVTADLSGDHYIDTASTSTITAVGSMTGYVSDTRTGITPADTVYFLTLYPTNMLPAAPAGSVNLIVKVQNALTKAVISGATVRAIPPSGASEYSTTSAAGVATFVMPNSSLIVLNANMAGYAGGTKNKVTSASGTDSVLIEISKAIVTTGPTVTGRKSVV